jgi:hypothetical protein
MTAARIQSEVLDGPLQTRSAAKWGENKDHQVRQIQTPDSLWRSVIDFAKAEHDNGGQIRVTDPLGRIVILIGVAAIPI